MIESENSTVRPTPVALGAALASSLAFQALSQICYSRHLRRSALLLDLCMHLASTLDGGLDFSIWRYCAALYSTRQQYGGSEENHIVLFHAVHSLAPPVSNAKLSPFCPRTTQKKSKRAKRKRTERNANALRNQAVTDFARLSDFAVLDPKADVLPIRRSRNCCKHLVYIMPQQLLEGQSGQTPNLGGVGNVRFRPYRLFNSRGHDPNNAHFACTACHDP